MGSFKRATLDCRDTDTAEEGTLYSETSVSQTRELHKGVTVAGRRDSRCKGPKTRMNLDV